jgi:protein phosphatase PTC7
MKYSIK